MPDRPSPPALILGPNCLRRILDYIQVMAPRNLYDWIHVGYLAIQMHRNDRARTLGDCRLNAGWVEVKRERIDIDKDWASAKPRNRSSRGKEGVGCRDHLIAWLDIDRHQCNKQCIGAR